MRSTIFAAALLAVSAVGLFAQPAQPAKPAPAAPKGPSPKSKEELAGLQAWQAAMQANDSDGIIKACEDVLTKFPSTDYKAIILDSEAEAYKRKSDWVNAQIYAGMALAADPQDYRASAMLADIPAKHTGEHDLDKEESLSKAEKYAHQTIEIVNAAPKLAQLTDEQWVEYQKQIAAGAQDDIGLVATARKSWDAAIAAYRAAIALTPEPAYKVHLASALQSSGKPDEAIAVCNEVLAEPNLHPQIQSAAKSVRANATAAKAMAK